MGFVVWEVESEMNFGWKETKLAIVTRRRLIEVKRSEGKGFDGSVGKLQRFNGSGETLQSIVQNLPITFAILKPTYVETLC
jgi:hypothetical protein